tara:strand:+ start:869 stop:1252 length:384 start_codon:yes stop_codon:yes gene_type:complete
MASELRVNTLKDASGNNSIATSFVAQGSAKYFAMVTNSGTYAVANSLGTSSVTDDSAGNFTITGISAMENTNQAAVGTCAFAASNPSNNNLACIMETTTTLAVETVNSSGTSADVANNELVIHGDLA